MKSGRLNIGKEPWKRSGGTLGLCVAAIMLAACSDVFGQFTLVRHMIGGGGGVSVGVNPPNGNYTVNVTLGDPLVGSSQGGSYTLSSGFLSSPGDQQTPEDAPELLIALNGNRMVLSWALPATGWVLDRTSALVDAATSWTEVSASYQTNNTHVLVTIPMSAEDTFFRLRKP